MHNPERMPPAVGHRKRPFGELLALPFVSFSGPAIHSGLTSAMATRTGLSPPRSYCRCTAVARRYRNGTRLLPPDVMRKSTFSSKSAGSPPRQMRKVLLLTMVSGVISPTISPASTRQYFGSPYPNQHRIEMKRSVWSESTTARERKSKMDAHPDGVGVCLTDDTGRCAFRTLSP